MRWSLLLAGFIIFCNPLYASPTSCTEHQCIAVIDAGSTGSRLHIYAYDSDKTHSPINIQEIWNKKIKPGFATIEPNSNTIDAYLGTLFSGAPTEHLAVYFYATAGMRLLPPTRQKKYYNELHNWFAQSSWQLVDAKTLTGNEEALYDWLSVNSHLGNFTANHDNSVGVMDMGGASVQIVFPIMKNANIKKSSQVELDLYGKHYNLFVHSFLGLGQTEMSHQFLNSVSCFANNFALPDGDMGQGNAPLCAHEVASLMNNVHGVDQLIQPLLSANPVTSWYALGGITNLADSKLFHFEKGQLTNQNLMQQGDSQTCHQQWDTLNEQFPDDDYVYEYCLFSAYYYALMVDGYGISPEQPVNYISPNQNLDWTLGVVLHHKV